ANQFEALFMQQLLKSMRDAIPRSGMLDGPGQSTYEGMLDSQLAQSVAGQPGGLADILVRQLGRHIEGATPDAGAPTSLGDAFGAAPGRPAGAELAPGLRRTLAPISTVGGLPGVLANALGRAGP